MFNEPLYLRRKIGEKVDVTFSFVRENIKLILKSVSLFSIPFTLIVSFLLIWGVISEDLNHTRTTTFVEAMSIDVFSLLIFASIAIDILLIMPVSFVMVKTHYYGGDGLKNKKTRDLLKPYGKVLGKTLTMPFLPVALFVFIYCFVNIFINDWYYSGGEWIGYTILSLLAFILFSMSLPLYVVADKKYSQSFGDSLALGISAFWNTLLFTLVMFTLCLLTYLWEVFLMEFLLSMRPEITGSHFGQHPVAFIISWIILLLLFVAITISVSIALSVGCVGLTFQMGSLEDRTHLISINERINNFENLKDI